MTAATDRRQLWFDARDALAKSRDCASGPPDDEESFAAFVCGVLAATASAATYLSSAFALIQVCPLAYLCS